MDARVEQLLYEGERVEGSVEWDGARVVVTTHRVLTFTPELEGANFSQADRPNVEGVTTGARSNADLLGRALKAGLVGVVLVAVGAAVDFDSLVGGVALDTSATGQVGLGGLGSTVNRLVNLIANLDRLLQTGGALALLVAVLLAGGYWLTRTPTLTVRVAGGEDMELPRPDEEVQERLRGALGAVDEGLTGQLGT